MKKNIIFILFIIVIIYIIILCYYKNIYNSYLDLKDIQNINFSNKNIKNCLLISGQIRNNYYATLFSQKIFLIDPFKLDVFCVFEDDINQNIKNEIIKLLNPKKIIWIDSSKFNYPDRKIHINYYYMMIKIKLSNHLKNIYEIENNFSYDNVIKTRPDIYIKYYLPFYIVNNNKKNIVYSPYFSFIEHIFFMGINDQIWICDNNTMNLISNSEYFFYKNCNSSEILLKKFLLNNNIKIHYFNHYSFVIDKLNSSHITFFNLYKKIFYILNKPFILKCI